MPPKADTTRSTAGYLDAAHQNARSTSAHLNHWLARSVQPVPSQQAWAPDDVGVVSARRQPTGWFISARCRPNLSGDEQSMFAEFVHLRVLDLLEVGPRPGSWLPGDAEDEWQTFSVAA